MSSEFWCVWNPQLNQPRFKHDSEQSAKFEAKRLARIKPDTPFYVLKAVGVEINRTVVFEKIGTDENGFVSDDEIPF